jgi:hypothetical protein
LIAIAVVLALGGIIGLLIFESRLDAHVRETEANATIASWALNDVNSEEQQLLSLSIGSCQSVKLLNTWLEGLTSAQRESIPNSAQVLTDVRNICQFDPSRYQALGPFLTSYVKGVGLRQAGDYEGAAAAYQEALSAGGIEPEWRARAFEGLGYAQWKLQAAGDAQASLASAVALKVDYVFTQITQLKIACAARQNAKGVQAMFAAALNQRDDHIRTAKTPELHDIAVKDRQLLLTDPEMSRLCGYAGVPGRA